THTHFTVFGDGPCRHDVFGRVAYTPVYILGAHKLKSPLRQGIFFCCFVVSFYPHPPTHPPTPSYPPKTHKYDSVLFPRVCPSYCGNGTVRHPRSPPAPQLAAQHALVRFPVKTLIYGVTSRLDEV
ncbi:hypothetical protein BC937DRAFT_87951, partial [Endogone sp. FLAS-F59071]